ncbi:MAG: hypothetical protein AAF684_08010, partial [Pseudomonadota bacterium]
MRIITLIAPAGELTEEHVAQAAAAMRTIEGKISNEVWLTEGEAAEMTIDSQVSDGTIVTAARYILGDAKIDIGVQRIAEDRR